MMAGVFLGAIGFPVIYTLWRHRWHVRHWSLHAKLTLITTVLLFFAGAAVFLTLEFDNPATFGSMNACDTVFQSFFLSAMTRSGGFSVVDIGHLNGSSLIVGSMLMFVGGGSASTAGGIKVTTLAVLALAVWSRGEGPPVRAGVRPAHPERRAAGRPVGRRLGRDDRRAVDHHDHPVHQAPSTTSSST